MTTRPAAEPELSIDWLADTSTDLRSIPFGAMLAAVIDTAEEPTAAAVQWILNWLVFAPSTDTPAAIWAWAVDTDTEDGRDAAAADRFFDLGTHYLLSYSTAAVATYILNRWGHHLAPRLVLKAAMYAAADPSPAGAAGLSADTDRAVEVFLNVNTAEWHANEDLFRVLLDAVNDHDLELPGPTPVRCPPPGDGHDMEGCGAIVTGGTDWEGFYDCPECGLFFNAEEAVAVDGDADGLSPTATDTVALTVEVPAVWVGLVTHGSHRDGHDELGRPVLGGSAAIPTDARVHAADVRDLPALDHASDGLFASLHLIAEDGRYRTDVVVWPDGPTPGPVLIEEAFDLRSGDRTDRTFTHRDGRSVVIDVRILWASANARAIAIDTVKRLYSVSKPVAARIVDEARFDLIDTNSPSVAEVVGSVALGHQDPAVVASLAIDFGPERTVAEIPVHGPRPRRCTISGMDAGSRGVILHGGDWTTVEVDGQTVPTGLPANGGPNPITAAKRIAKLLEN